MKTKTGSVYNFRSQNESTAQPIGREHRPGSSASVETAEDKPIGTKKAGYAGAEEGPFECSNCVHYTEQGDEHGECDHPDVIADAKAGEISMSGSGALVESAGCCTYFRPLEEEGKNENEQSDSEA
jgi:hypothetical protein